MTYQRIPRDPLTYRYPRYPHEHATPAEYAKSMEGPVPDLDADWLYWIALVCSVGSIVAVAAIIVFEWAK